MGNSNSIIGDSSDIMGDSNDRLSNGNSSDIISSFEKMMLIDCIYQQVEEYLDDTSSELYKKKKNTDANSILNVSKKFNDMKSSNYYLKLNREYSLEYHSNADYKSTLDSLFINPNTQLSINLDHCNTISDFSPFGNVHTLDISFCNGVSDISALGNVHTLHISGCQGISDVSGLGNVHTLDMMVCDGVRDVRYVGYIQSIYLKAYSKKSSDLATAPNPNSNPNFNSNPNLVLLVMCIRYT